MITGTIKSQIDQIWNTFWTGGISNPRGRAAIAGVGVLFASLQHRAFRGEA